MRRPLTALLMRAALAASVVIAAVVLASPAQAEVNFGAPTDFTAGDGTISVAVGDFNRDSKPDLAVANRNATNVSVLLNDTNSPPDAKDDSATTKEDNAVTIDVLANDSDPDGDALTVGGVTQPANGSAAINADNTVTYTPKSNFNGTDTFTYTVSDGNGATDTATVTVTANAVNDAPTVAVAAGGSCGTNDRSGTIKLTVEDQETAVADLSLSVTTSNGTLVPTSNLTFGGTGANRTLTATAVSGRTGTATLTVTVSDGTATGTPLALTLKAGGNSNDTLAGTSATTSLSGTDILLGQNGADVLNGLGANDLLCGGRGNDTLSGDAGDDTMTGGTGADRFSGGTGTDTVIDFTPSQGDTKDNTIP